MPSHRYMPFPGTTWTPTADGAVDGAAADGAAQARAPDRRRAVDEGLAPSRRDGAGGASWGLVVVLVPEMPGGGTPLGEAF